MTIGRLRRANRLTHLSALLELGRDFARHRTTAERAWRRYQNEDDAVSGEPASTAHRAWSSAIDKALAAVEALSRQQPTDIDDLIIQFEAIWWWIKEDDTVLDKSTRRWLMRFRRSPRRLAA